MNDISNRLLSFFTAKAPDAINRLPGTSFFGESGYPVGRNLHFILRLGWEGNDILKRGDPFVKPVRFTRDDIVGLREAHYIVRAALGKKAFDDESIAVVRTMPSLMLKIASYHEAQGKVLERRVTQKQRDLVLTWLRYDNHWGSEGNGGLLEFFPDAERLLYGVKFPAHYGNIIPIERAGLDEAIKRSIGGAYSLLSESPKIIRDIEATIDELNNGIERYSSIFQAVKTVSEGLDEALYPKPKRMPRIIPFSQMHR